jgi:hypothetical protein
MKTHRTYDRADQVPDFRLRSPLVAGPFPIIAALHMHAVAAASSRPLSLHAPQLLSAEVSAHRRGNKWRGTIVLRRVGLSKPE